MRPLFFLCLVLATASAQAAVHDVDPDFYAGGSAIAGERVIDLPQDAHAWFCTVFESTTGGRVQSWFATNPQLTKMRDQTHFNVYSPQSPLWTRYWNGMPDANGVEHGPLISQLPAVVLQKPVQSGGYEVVARFQGKSCHLDSASNLSRALASCIRSSAEAGRMKPCPDCRPKPKPEPQPYQPDPGPFGPKPLVPDIEPPEEVIEEQVAKQEETDGLVYLGLAVATAAIGYVVLQSKRTR